MPPAAKKGKGKEKAEGGKALPPTPPTKKPITKIGQGNVVELYQGAPEGIICPSFWNFKPFNGCHFDCQWCFLNGTFRFAKEDAKKPRMKKYERGILDDLDEALDTVPGPQLFNMGELADALLFEGYVINHVIPRFAASYNEAEDLEPGTGHKLLIVTKSASEHTIHSAGAKKSVIFSHSVNAKYVAHRWELKAPHPWARLTASKSAHEEGFETRLRIDPMVPVSNWKDGYRELCEKIMEINPHVSVITIGSLRALQSTVNACVSLKMDRSWIQYCTEDSPFGRKIEYNTRKEMYSFVIETLRDLGYKGKFGICKETPKMWFDMRRLLKEGETKCNCQI